MTNNHANEELLKLELSILERNAKIEDVKDRIVRQKDHIEKTQNKMEKFEDHLARWLRQNERDQKRIEELKRRLPEGSIPVKVLDVSTTDEGVTIYGTADMKTENQVKGMSIVESKKEDKK